MVEKAEEEEKEGGGMAVSLFEKGTGDGFFPLDLASSSVASMGHTIVPYLESKGFSVYNREVDVDALRRQEEDAREKEERERSEGNKATFIAELEVVLSEAGEIGDEAREEAEEHKSRGNEHFLNRDYDLAIEHYSLAITLVPDNAKLYSNRSATHLARQDPRQAMADAHKCVHLAPDWPKAHFRLAKALFELGDFEEAAVVAWEGYMKEGGQQSDSELKSLFDKAIKRAKREYGSRK
jgi:tetratricopeptide (TPR) repeat protein